MGVTHLRAHLDNPQARVVAVCDAVRLPVNGVLPGVTGNIKKSDDIPLDAGVKSYRTLAEVLQDPDVALVDLCTPTALHLEQAIASLEAGKHVVCEKPLARTSADARRIVEVADRSPGMLMPAMCMRFWPGWASLKQILEEATHGRVLAARFRRVSGMPVWSKPGTYTAEAGGALFDLHIHDTDFIQHLFGRPTQVFSSGVVGEGGVINHVATHYRYPNGPAVHAEGSWLLTDGFNMAFTLHGERATLDFDLARGNDAFVITESGKPPRGIPAAGPDGYGAELRYIVECVASGRAPTIVTARDAVAALEICEAEEKSIRTGAPINL
jgi:predicted dehydrogenase